MSNPTFLRRYKNIFCISGTFGDSVDRSELREVYNLTGFDVPSHHQLKRIDRPLTLLKSPQRWRKMILDLVSDAAPRQPVLLITSSIRESQELHSYLQNSGLKCQLLNDVDNKDELGAKQSEEVLIKGASRIGIVTVATGVAGRGADIVPDPSSIAAGGVYSLLTFIPENKRVEYQARGRAGRQGNPGISEIVACAQTDLFFNKLSKDIQDLILFISDRFGSESEELHQTISFVRRAQGIGDSLWRRTVIQKDEVIQEALETYFNSLASVSEKLLESNAIFRQHQHKNLANYVTSLFIGETWNRDFEELDTVLSHRDLLVAESLSDDKPLRSAPALFEAYEEIFRIPFDERMDAENVEFLSLVERIVRGSVIGLSRLELRLREVNNDEVSEMLTRLVGKVQDLTQRCEEFFVDAKPDKIQKFLDENEEKKKERRKKEPPK